MTSRLRLSTVLVLALAVASCSPKPAPKQYQLEGQILAVDAAQQQLTIKHGDIAGLMPGMTMSFPVARPDLMQGRSAGELVTATLEVQDSIGRLVDITATGTAPLPPVGSAILTAGGLLAPGDEVPDTALIDQFDKRRSLSEWRGSLTVITFMYTTCPLPTFCPLMDQNLSTIQRAVAEDAVLRGKVKLISVSLDPEHDTPAILAAHAGKRKADAAVWTFLTGDRLTVERLAARFGVGVVRDAPDAPGITHNLRTSLVGADGKIVKLYTGSDWTPGTVIADLRAAAHGP